MAYALQDEEQFQKSWQPQQPQTGGAPVSGSTGTAIAPGAAEQSAPGSRFVSFDRYLGANQEAAAKTAEKLGYQVQQKGAEAKSAIGQADKDFASATTQGMGGAYEASRNPTKTLLPPSGPASFQQQGGSNGTTVVTKAAQGLQSQPGYSLQEAQALANTKYTGPTSLDEFRPELRGQVEGAQRTAAQLGTEQGRRALLTEGMARQAGAYGGGMASLDEALASGVGDNREKFGKTAGAFGQLGKWLGDAGTQAAATADMARKGTEFQANRFGGLVKDFQTQQEANQKLTAASEGQAKQVAEVADFMGQKGFEGKKGEAFRPFLTDFRQRFGRMPNDAELRDLVRFGPPTVLGG